MARHESPIRRVCIIGAGPCGLAAARYLLSNPHFTQISIFEQRPNVGGVWNINEKNVKPTPVPSEDPFWNNDPNDYDKEGERNEVGASFDSPLHPSLEINIPHQIMAYQQLPFTEVAETLKREGQDIEDPSATVNLDATSRNTVDRSKDSGIHNGANGQTKDFPHVPLYPLYPTVLNYIRVYSLPLLSHIRFSTLVLSAEPIPSENPLENQWRITTLDLNDKTHTTEVYDALVVANGHYTIPYLPSIPGIEAFHAAYPDVISHARDFRTTESYRGKKTVLVGASASAVDIGRQLEEVCQPPLIKVVRSGNDGSNPTTYKSIDAFLPPSTTSSTDGLPPKSIKFTTVTGATHIESSIDKVLFATGYLYNFPFFPQPLQVSLVGQTHGLRVAGLYKQLFLRQHPTCAFMVLPVKVVPFPLAEAQASVITRVWAGSLPLPSSAAMEQDEQELLEKKGEGKGFHTMGPDEDVEYMNDMVRWAGLADDKPGDDERGGLIAEPWNDEIRWLRSRFLEMRKRYKERGEKRFEVQTWDELGFDYRGWIAEQRQKQQEEGDKKSTQEQGQVSG